MLLRPDSKSSFCEKLNAFAIDGSPFDHFGQMGSSVAVEILRSTKNANSSRVLTVMFFGISLVQ